LADKTPVIFDTDIGSDVDDAVALAYLLRQPRCDLLGITTVTGEVRKRAALAQVLCEAAARPEVPIHCGTSAVLLYGAGQPDVPQYEAIRDVPHRLDWPQNTAVDFMRRTIRERPGEVVLVSVGPFTNVALLFALDPEIPSLLKGWVSMGGVFFAGPEAKAEWNSRCDPLATAIAFQRGRPNHVNVGLDVTLQCRLTADDVRKRFRDPLLALVLRMAEVWFQHASRVVFHDPLAAALVFRRDLCGTQRGYVEFDPSSQLAGFTPDPQGPDEVAAEVDVEAFFEEYFSVFAPGS
jgi:purine nucleosidase